MTHSEEQESVAMEAAVPEELEMTQEESATSASTEAASKEEDLGSEVTDSSDEIRWEPETIVPPTTAAAEAQPAISSATAFSFSSMKSALRSVFTSAIKSMEEDPKLAATTPKRRRATTPEDKTKNALTTTKSARSRSVWQVLTGSPVSPASSAARRPLEPVLQDTITALRFLVADVIQSSKSGHPGLPLGMAPAAVVLFDRHLRFNPVNPSWMNRDRFVLSAGHGSLLLYSLLHLYGYDSVSMDDLKRFRTYGSKTTPGHPENLATAGVEVTTGALGQGFANAVGIALAEQHLRGVYAPPAGDDRTTYVAERAEGVVGHYTYCLVGDGCLMEGISAEAASLAGHWKLGKLIVLYDDNGITIDGGTEQAFTEDVAGRMEAMGWHVVEVADGNTDLEALDAALDAAKAATHAPSLIKIQTTIGYGAPTKAGTNGIHGSLLGEEEIELMRKSLGWPHEAFHVPDDVLLHTRAKRDAGQQLEEVWWQRVHAMAAQDPELGQRFFTHVLAEVPHAEQLVHRKQVEDALRATAMELVEKAADLATRNISQTMLNAVAPLVKGLIGGSADLASSCMTDLTAEAHFQASCPAGRNVHFGVREHAMGSISNGLALYGAGLVPYCATFLVFSDYMRASIRTAALSGAGTLFVMTHDSVMVGEDGPTHQPVEHLASLRAMPNVSVYRPASATEMAACYQMALQQRNAPSLMICSRQKVDVLAQGSYDGALRGAYVYDLGQDNCIVAQDNTHAGEDEIDLLLIATGSELSMTVAAAKRLSEERAVRVRVVSMPCVEVFLEQDAAYQEKVLPKQVDLDRRMVVEAASSFGWHRFAGHFHTVDAFGISAPGKNVAQHFKLTTKDVYEHARSILELA